MISKGKYFGCAVLAGLTLALPSLSEARDLRYATGFPTSETFEALTQGILDCTLGDPADLVAKIETIPELEAIIIERVMSKIDLETYGL